jgi:hypothetical protein
MSAKQLYRVDVSFEMYVMAKSEDEARDIAIDGVYDSQRVGIFDAYVCRPTGKLNSSEGKRRPLGADAGDKRTLAQILNDEAKASAA